MDKTKIVFLNILSDMVSEGGGYDKANLFISLLKCTKYYIKSHVFHDIKERFILITVL